MRIADIVMFHDELELLPEGVVDEAVTVRDSEIVRLQGALETAVSARDAEIRRLQYVVESVSR